LQSIEFQINSYPSLTNYFEGKEKGNRHSIRLSPAMMPEATGMVYMAERAGLYFANISASVAPINMDMKFHAGMIRDRPKPIAEGMKGSTLRGDRISIRGMIAPIRMPIKSPHWAVGCSDARRFER
jgi:hypothetical protein